MCRIILKSLQCIENGNQEWHLNEKWQTSCQRGNVVFPVKLLHFNRQLRSVVLIFFLKRRYLWLNFLHALHGFNLLQCKRKQKHLNDDGKDNDCNTVAWEPQACCQIIEKLHSPRHHIGQPAYQRAENRNLKMAHIFSLCGLNFIRPTYLLF